MKYFRVVLLACLLLGLGASQASSDVVLFDWGLNIDGTLYYPGDPLPGSVGSAGFDFTAGLGSFVVTLTAPGSHYVGAFFDHEIDEETNTFFNEFGASLGSPYAGQTWEIDEPGYVFGDISANFAAGALDGTNGVPAAAPDDVSMALAYEFALAADEQGVVSFMLGTAAPAAGFYLSQYDPDSAGALHFSGGLTISGGGPEPVPEPSTLILLGSGLAGLIRFGRGKTSNKR